jgi:hypothetical protein
VTIEERYRYERARYAWTADCFLWRRYWPTALTAWGKPEHDGLVPYFRYSDES